MKSVRYVARSGFGLFKKPRKLAIGRILDVKITMILKFFKAIWAVFDVIMFVLAAISANLTTFYQQHIAFGISMTITFILAGLISELISGKGKE